MVVLDFDLERDVPDLTGKVILVTGGTAGLGASSVGLLAKRNPSRIYITGRNSEAANNVIRDIRRETPESKAEIHFIKCDLTNLSSVKEAAGYLLERESRLDVLMANAGIMATSPGLTKDGYEVQFGTNHIGHALMIRKLLPLLEKTAALPGADVRIISLASVGFVMAPRQDGIVFDELRTTQDYWILGPWQRYGQSKLANILYARELARRYPSITTVAIHPGTTPTNLISGLSLKNKSVVWLGTMGQSQTLEQGPWNQVWAVGAPKDKIVSGNFYEPVGINSEDQLNSHALNQNLAEKLWDWTEKEIKAYL
ncbi:NAD(P)-binding protein [Annulohypoxylon maeteangense]|uniref:NAD(P)-binding protein n=1 Tax=Annulohypoxylon maeteangense TaxID=1927788 RepID=UPI0020084ED3|nr:NAD(P)-binding protein [Annulohypoxylon maeteangense]KAI0889388.1 NAD(P)-binding protein [Annulohypoxylon maeteangense]